MKLNFHEYQNIKNSIANMGQKELSDYLTKVYSSGFEDAKKQIGISDADISIWDSDKLEQVLIKNYISPRLAKKIVEELTQ